MDRTNLKFAVAYLVLVALPLLGLAGILRSGRALSAPVSVGGLWRIQPNPEKVAVLPCGKSPAAVDESFVISQSGRTFTLRFEESYLSSASGAIEGTTIKASLLPTAKWAQQTQCDERRALTLTATVDSGVKPRLLTAVLSVDGCPTCFPVKFRAVRESQPE